MKEKLKTKKFLKVGAILAVLLFVCIGIAVYAAQQVEIEVSQVPNVDVVLTKSKTRVDLTNFSDDLKNEFVNQGVMSQAQINAGKLTVQALDSEIVENQETLDWKTSVSPSIGSLTLQNSGTDVTMKGNTSKPGKNAIWISPETNQEQEFQFNYNINFGDSFNAAGMLLRVEERDNNTLAGYMLSFNHKNHTFYNGCNANAALWKFVYDKNNAVAFNVGTDINLVRALSINTSGTLQVKVSDTEIRIAGGGLSSEAVYQIPSDKTFGCGYGFFSDHYSHGCDQIGSFDLRGIQLKITESKKLVEVLQAPEWRDGSVRVLVNVEDVNDEQFSNPDELKAIVSKLMDKDIYFTGWGTNENQTQLNNVVKANDNKGIYINNTQATAIAQTVAYMKTLIKAKTSPYVIVREDVDVNLTKPAGGVETPTTAYPNGVWKVVHDYNYFENPEGQYSKDSMYTNDLISSFDNVGKYSIYCEDRLVKEIYAHRRPIAEFSMQMANNQLTLRNLSYDLDIEVNADNYQQQKNNKGIQSVKWEYKDADNSNAGWTQISSGGVTSPTVAAIQANKNYYVRLTVTDYQGETAEATKYITNSTNNTKPVASFDIVKNPVSVYENLEIVDGSYDPSGYSLTYAWTVIKTSNNETVYTGSTPLLNFSTSNNNKCGVGNYRIELVVSKTVSGNTISSDVFSQNVEITNDNTAPNIIINPISKETVNEPIEIAVKVKDNESGLLKYKYAFTESNQPASASSFTEVSLSNVKEKDVTLTVPVTQWDKHLYLHIKATNRDGVETQERIVGEYYIEPSFKIDILAVDKDDLSGLKDAKFDVYGEYSDGSTIEFAKDAVTNSSGRLLISKAKLINVKKLKIVNTEEPEGYKKLGYKTIGVNTSNYIIEVDNSLTSNDIEISRQDNNKAMTIKIPFERKEFSLKITNKDVDTDMLISNTKFALKQNGVVVASGVTQNGELTLDAPIAGINKEKDYYLEQQEVSDIYNNAGTTVLKIKFDADGNVQKMSQKLFMVNSNAEIPDDTKAEIIINNERKEKSTFSVNINVKDYSTSENVKGSEYCVRVEGSNNLDFTSDPVASDEDGNIRIDGLYGAGLLKLTFINSCAAEGYAKSSDRYITVKRDLNDESITYNAASMHNIFDKVENTVVFVNLTDTQMNSANAIRIKAVSSLDSSIGLDGIEFKIYKMLGDELIAQGTTDSEGILELSNIVPDGQGEIVYKIVSDDASVLGSNVLFAIKYDKYKRMEEVNEITNNENVNVSFTSDVTATEYKRLALVSVNCEQEEIEGDNKLIITSKTEDGTKLEGIDYQIKIKHATTNTRIESTDENGIAETNLPNTNVIELEIKQVKTANGYKIDQTVKTIQLTRDTNDRLTVLSADNIEASAVTIDASGNVCVNDVIKTVHDANIWFNIKTVNSQNNLKLGGAKFRVTEETTGYNEIVTTNISGYAKVETPFEVNTAKSYNFKVEQISATTNYKPIETSIKMETTFEDNASRLVYKGVQYTDGLVSIIDNTDNYDVANNDVKLYLTINNEATEHAVGSDNTGVYNLDIVKQDKDGNVVSGSEYDIEIRPYAESSIKSLGCKITNSVEITDLVVTEEKTTILLKETKAALGCDLDSDMKVVTIKLDEDGNIICEADGTSYHNVTVSIKKVVSAGVEKNVVEVVIKAEEPTGTEPPAVTPPTTPTEPTNPDDPLDGANVIFNIYNEELGDYKYPYSKEFHWYNYSTGTSGWSWGTAYTPLDGVQRLLRMFDKNGSFTKIKAAKITLEARLMENGGVNSEVYETATAIKTDGGNITHKIGLKNDYANKTVEFTVIEDIPAINHKANTTNAKMIVIFDANGKIESGYVSGGSDLNEFGIPGISSGGVVDNFKLLKTQNRRGYQTFTTHDVRDFDCRGTNTINMAMINEYIDTRVDVKINLTDEDSLEGIDGPVTVIIEDITDEENSKVLETKTINVSNGNGLATLDNAYPNRKLRLTICQTAPATKTPIKYIDSTNNVLRFELLTDSIGDIKTDSLDEKQVPDNMSIDALQERQISVSITNEIWYNFAINVNKLDENGEPLKGVRYKTKVGFITDAAGNSVNIFKHVSGETDENGKVKLKIDLPTSGTYKYYGHTLDFTLDEVYVPNNYKATQNKKIRVLFDNVGNILQTEVVIGYGEDIISVTGKDNLDPDGLEKHSFDISMVNEPITDKPVFEITNADADDTTVKLEGTKYRISVTDASEYTSDHLNIDEVKLSYLTEEDGQTTVEFDNAHALRTMLYRIEEIQTSPSYLTNNDIVLQVKYDKDGNIAEVPVALTTQTITNSNHEVVPVIKVVGNPVGFKTLQLEIINEIKPKFVINLAKVDENSDYKQKVEYVGEVREKIADNSYTDELETRASKFTDSPTHGSYLGFKTETASKTLLYTVYEKTGEVLTKRGEFEVTFDRYGNVVSGGVSPILEKEDNYIKNYNIPVGTQAMNATFKVDNFKIEIQVEDTTGSGYSLAGFEFQIKNMYEETNKAGLLTNNTGKVTEITSGKYKGKTVIYNLETVKSAIDYEDIPGFSIQVTYDDDGMIEKVDPTHIEDVYDLVSSENGKYLKIKLYTIPSIRNSVELNITDLYSHEEISTADYTITTPAGSFTGTIEDPYKEIDIGSYKNYSYNTTQTVTLVLKQDSVDSQYMINDNDIKIAVTYTEGLITAANIIESDGYVEIDDFHSIGTTKLILNTNNVKKTQMDLMFESSKNIQTKIPGAEFKIIEDEKNDLYSDTQTTNLDGQAELWVGPNYKDTTVTYNLVNTQQAKEFKKVPNTTFTLTYDSDGIVTDYFIPQAAAEYMTIIPDANSRGHINIILKADPLFTVGVESILKTTGTQVAGGKYEITQDDNALNTDSVTTQANIIVHAAVGETEQSRTVTYNIIERQAPAGTKYHGKDTVIGKLQVEYDVNSEIIVANTQVIEGSDYIKLVTPTDKLNKYDVDIIIEYDEIDEFQVIIEDIDTIDNTKHVISTFTGVLPNNTITTSTDTVDSDTGIATLRFGKVSIINSTQILSISQSNVEEGYMAVLEMRLRVQFDESGKVKGVQPISGSGLAVNDVAYIVEPIATTGQYVLKITVLNNPVTTINIINIEDGTSNVPVNSTHTLSGMGITPKTETTDVTGTARYILESVPKNEQIQYTLRQDSVDLGYTRNKDIVFNVKYDNSGKVQSVSPKTSSDYADSSVYTVVSFQDYVINLEIKNKTVFEIYLQAVDAFDENIKLQNVRVDIEENTYSHLEETLLTDVDGVAQTELGSTFASKTLTYKVDILNNIAGYTEDMDNINGNISVTFNNVGDIIQISSDNPLIEADYQNGKAIVVKVKYVPVITMDITRRDLASNSVISGRQLKISSVQMNGNKSATTDANGKIHLDDAGKIVANDKVIYTIEEYNSSAYSAMDKMDPATIEVSYDSEGYISSINPSDPEMIICSGVGTRNLNVDIGSTAKATISIIDLDANINTTYINGSFDINSEKGESLTLNSTMTPNYVIDKLGRVYSGETVKYTIHQTSVANGYAIIPDTDIFVEYDQNGLVSNVTSSDTERVTVKTINANSTDKTPNIVLEVHNKPALLVSFNVVDKLYGDGVEGLNFTVRDEVTGRVSTSTAVTDNGGQLTIPVESGLKNVHRTYTITNVKTKGGYKQLPTVRVIVEYDASGVIVENGTYVVDNTDVNLTTGYSAAMFTNAKLRAIQLNYKAESELGIGIVNTDINSNPISGIEYIITAKDTTAVDASYGKRTITNENGTAIEYVNDMPKNKIIDYTIIQLQAPNGCRKMEDLTIRAQFDGDGKIYAYTLLDNQGEIINPIDLPNITVNVATNHLIKLSGDDNKAVHISVTVKSDDRFTFKIVNIENNTNVPIKGSVFQMSVDDNTGTIFDDTKITDMKGEAVVENIDSSGRIRLYYKQLSLEKGYSENTTSTGYIDIEKSTGVYNLQLKDKSDNLEFDINNDTGVVTIYVRNDNRFVLTVTDVDNITSNIVLGAEHKIKMHVGEKSDNDQDIIDAIDNIVDENKSYTNVDGVTEMILGNTYDLADKKVVYEVTTPTTATGYSAIGSVYFVVEYDSKGRIDTINGISARIMSLLKQGNTVVDLYIGFGDLDFYTIKIAKESSYADTNGNSVRVNGAEFEVNFNLDGNDVYRDVNKLTDDKIIGSTVVESGIIEYRDLKYEGHLVVSMEETNSPDGYNSNNTNSTVQLDLELDKTDPDDVQLIINDSSSNNADVSIDYITKEILITIKNDPSIKLIIHKKDEGGIGLGNVSFNLKVQEQGTTSVIDYGKVTTDSFGTIEKDISNIYLDKTILIILKEDKQDNYQEIPKIVIKAYVKPDGKLETSTLDITSGDEYATIENSDDHSIEFDVINKLDPYAIKYSIVIKKYDAFSTSVRPKGAVFQVKMIPESGNPSYKVATIDDSGQVSLDNLVGEGVIRIELKEIIAPEGYTLQEDRGYYTYRLSKVGTTISQIDNSDGAVWQVDSLNRKVIIDVTNELEKVSYVIQAVDKEDHDLKLKGAEYTITEVDTGTSDTKTTDLFGNAQFIYEKETSAVLKRYKVKQTTAPDGYKLDNTERELYVKYNSEGKIDSIISDNGIELVKQQDYYIELLMENEQKESTLDKYNIKLINVDENDDSITLPGAEFSISVAQTVGVTSLYKQKETNGAGEISINNINGAGSIAITVENLKASEGYQLIDDIDNISITRDPVNGKITSLSSDVSDVQFDDTTRTLIIKMKSKKLINAFNLKLNLLEKDTKALITDTNGLYEVDINGKKYNMNILSNGTAKIDGIEIDDVTDFEMTITEKKSITGYNDITEQKLKVSVLKAYDEKTISDVNITSGNNVEIESKMTNYIELNILKEQESEDEKLYLTSNVYNISETYIERVKPNTTVRDFFGNLDTNGNMVVYDKDNQAVSEDALVGTGMTLVDTRNDERIDKTIYVVGDLDGNGKISLVDLSLLNQSLVKKTVLSEVQSKAADLNNDGKVSLLDLSLINQVLTGKMNTSDLP